MIKYFFAIFFTLSLFLTCREFTNQDTYIPFIRPQNTLPLVFAYYNGKPAWFLLDTGASSSILDSNQLYTYGCYSDTISYGDFVGVGGASNISLPIGSSDLRINNNQYKINFYTTNLLDAVEVIRINQGKKILGVLGSNFINKYSGEINYRTNTLRLIKR
jgi:hypothetical protein